MRQLLPLMPLHGPIIFSTSAADILVWAHWHMHVLLQMALHGSISFPKGAVDSFI